MSTDSSAPYQSHADFAPGGGGEYQVRYDQRIDQDWVKTNVNGEELFWIRARIVSTITSSMEIDFIKLHTDRTEINSDGFLEMFGKARAVKSLPLNYGTFEAAGNSPANNDIYLSDKLDVGRKENEFQDGTTDRSGFTKIMPLDMDTSTPIKFRIKFIGDNNTAGDLKFNVRWGTSKSGGYVYDSSTSAPATAPDEQISTGVMTTAAGQSDLEYIFDTYLDISRVTPEIGRHDATSLWVTFEREGNAAEDTYAGNAIIIDINLYYLSWRTGGYIDNY